MMLAELNLHPFRSPTEKGEKSYSLLGNSGRLSLFWLILLKSSLVTIRFNHNLLRNFLVEVALVSMGVLRFRRALLAEFYQTIVRGQTPTQLKKEEKDELLLRNIVFELALVNL